MRTNWRQWNKWVLEVDKSGSGGGGADPPIICPFIWGGAVIISILLLRPLDQEVSRATAAHTCSTGPGVLRSGPVSAEDSSPFMSDKLLMGSPERALSCDSSAPGFIHPWLRVKKDCCSFVGRTMRNTAESVLRTKGRKQLFSARNIRF